MNHLSGNLVGSVVGLGGGGGTPGGVRGSVSRMNMLLGMGGHAPPGMSMSMHNIMLSSSSSMLGSGGGLGHGGGMSTSGSIESRRQVVAEMISQIRKYDPYPCILGIPVMPALFATCRFYIFVCFLLIGTRVMVACMRELHNGAET